MPKPVTARQILDLIEKQNYRCAITGRPLTPETASLDHIVPVSRGGEHNLENLWVVDHQVNTAKGSMTYAEFLNLCHEVAAHQSGPSE